MAVAFEMLDLRAGVWKTNLRLYLRPASWPFDGTLHFVARLIIQ
jgi:hypothetical protein